MPISSHKAADGDGIVDDDQLVLTVAAREDQRRFRRGDGRYADLLAHGYIVRNEGGQPLRMVGAMTDITERKRVEEDLRSSQAFPKSTIDSIRDRRGEERP